MSIKTYDCELYLGTGMQFVVDVSISYDYTPGQISLHSGYWEASVQGLDPEIAFRSLSINKIVAPETVSVEWLKQHPDWNSWLINKLSDLVIDMMDEDDEFWAILADV